MSSPEQLTKMLVIILIVMVSILMILAAIYIVIRLKNSKGKKSDTITVKNNSNTTSDAKVIAKEYSKESIFKFLEFDKIEDNMIVQKKGNRYLMVVECQGVNYDLMSEAEKISVEEGFLQFLNTLRHPIQIYIQTRTVNLTDSLEGYNKKLNEIGTELEKMKNSYLRKVESGKYSKDELERDFYEVTKQTNLYEYGRDIIASTEKMSLNKSVLNKKYYIIIPYYPEDLSSGSFDKEEIKNLAFQELYTKSQSIIRTLSACEVGGKIMTSEELIDLLYVAYNRDESEVFSVDKALRAGYDELYSTAPDVLDRKMKELDEEVERQALAIVNEKVIQVRNKKQREIEQKQERFGELIRERAEMILQQNSAYLGTDTSAQAMELIKEEANLQKEEQNAEKEQTKKRVRKSRNTKEGGDSNVGEERKKTTRGRKSKVTSK